MIIVLWWLNNDSADAMQDMTVNSFLRQSSLVSTNVTSELEVFLNDMRYINPRFTYLLKQDKHGISYVTLNNKHKLAKFMHRSWTILASLSYVIKTCVQ